MSRIKGWIDRLTRSHQTYIMPTGHGVVFLIGIVFMVLVGATYSNNLIYLLAFFLFAAFVVSMVQTHHNIAKLSVEVISVEDAYNGGWAQLDLKLHHSQKAYRQNVAILFPDLEWAERATGQLEFLSPKGQARVSLSIKAKKRGRHSLPRIRLETKFPLGLFKSWRMLPLNGEAFVYPQAIGQKNLSSCRVSFGAQKGESAKASRGEEADFHEHKAYQLGESSRRVDWKLYARKRLKMIKSFEGRQEASFRFVYNESLGVDTEARLSQLSTWIEEARSKKLMFELWLPNKKIEMASGAQHARMSLRELAQFEDESVA